MRNRAPAKATIFERMQKADWAPLRNLSPDPRPKVKASLKRHRKPVAIGSGRKIAEIDWGGSPFACIQFDATNSAPLLELRHRR
jgi:hypothetical protein